MNKKILGIWAWALLLSASVFTPFAFADEVATDTTSTASVETTSNAMSYNVAKGNDYHSEFYLKWTYSWWNWVKLDDWRNVKVISSHLYKVSVWDSVELKLTGSFNSFRILDFMVNGSSLYYGNTTNTSSNNTTTVSNSTYPKSYSSSFTFVWTYDGKGKVYNSAGWYINIVTRVADKIPTDKAVTLHLSWTIDSFKINNIVVNDSWVSVYDM